MPTYCAAHLMELVAIPPGCQKTATKWLVMRRCLPTCFPSANDVMPRRALDIDLLVTVAGRC
jgi:hypothetical protein